MKNYIALQHRYVRESIPKGVGRHKIARSKLWCPEPPRRPAAVVFDLIGGCQGDPDRICELGLELARQALNDGNVVLAEKILARVELFRK